MTNEFDFDLPLCPASFTVEVRRPGCTPQLLCINLFPTASERDVWTDAPSAETHARPTGEPRQSPNLIRRDLIDTLPSVALAEDPDDPR